MADPTALVVRLVHVLALTLLLGGSLVAWLALRERAGAGPALARRFEWAFWAAVGLVVLTGVGNLGAVGVPDRTTTRGTVFAVKLLLVLALVLASAVRTLLLVRAGECGYPEGWRGLLARAYATTTGLALGIVVLGEVLAHG